MCVCLFSSHVFYIYVVSVFVDVCVLGLNYDECGFSLMIVLMLLLLVVLVRLMLVLMMILFM